MIAEEIQAFEQAWTTTMQRSRKLSIKIGSTEEMATIAKQLNDLQVITGQATEITDALSSDIQSLRISLNEAFSMATEAKSKHALFSNTE